MEGSHDDAVKLGIVGTVSFIAGGALVYVGLGMNPHPVAESDRRLMAHDYNKRLRKQLRLPGGASFVPYATPAGGGVLAVGRF
jgi:hypothetical protein